MLILQRRAGESILIGDNITLTVASVEGGRVQLAIDAPKNITILRSELKKAMDTNIDSANEGATPQELLDMLKTYPEKK